MDKSRIPVLVSALRTPVGRGRKGTLAHTRPDDLAALVLKETLARTGVPATEVEDVILGCAMPEGEQGFNVARLSLLLAGLPDTVPGMTVNRFCSSGLQSIALAAQAIASGMAECIIAGGVESMSMVPMTGNKPSMNLRLQKTLPGAYVGMGMTAENLARKYEISRTEQDQFALESHQKGASAQEAGRFADELVKVPVRVDKRKGAAVESKEVLFESDELVRADSSLETLAKLRPSFHVKGSVTPGNSSPISDGAAAVMVMSKAKAEAHGLEPIAEFLSFAVAGVSPEIMGIGPVEAVPKALKLAAFSHLVCLACLFGFWWLSGLGLIFLAAVVIVAGLLLYEHSIVRPDDLSRAGVAFFQINALISIGLLVAGIADLVLTR